MNQALSAILWGILTFSLLVVLHEGGHFAVARAFGVKVHEFMLGLPGPALRFHGKKTTYGVTADSAWAATCASPAWSRARKTRSWPTRSPTSRAWARATPPGSPTRSTSTCAEPRRCSSRWPTGTPSPPPTTTPTPTSPRPRPRQADDAAALLDEVRTHTYRGLPTWKRIAILSAGVVVNLARRAARLRRSC